MANVAHCVDMLEPGNEHDFSSAQLTALGDIFRDADDTGLPGDEMLFGELRGALQKAYGGPARSSPLLVHATELLEDLQDSPTQQLHRSRTRATRIRQLHAETRAALHSMGLSRLARRVAQRGVDLSLWREEWHTPPILNEQLRSEALPSPEGFPAVQRYIAVLESQWRQIHEEFEGMRDSLHNHQEGIHSGTWRVFELGAPALGTCLRDLAPTLCSFIARVDDMNLANKVWVQSVRFSSLQPGSSIQRHSAISNQRLKLHLGLLAPPGATMTIAMHTVHWQPGQCILFDDSFEHSVQQDAPTERVILELKLRHPDLEVSEEIDEESGAILASAARSDSAQRMNEMRQHLKAYVRNSSTLKQNTRMEL